MAMPVLASFAQELYDRLAPLQYDEANQDYALAKLCAAIGEMFQVVEDLSRDGTDLDGKEAPGWSQLLDIDRTPNYALGWLAQFVGVTLRAGLTDAAQRQRIKNTDGWNRGTPAAIVAAAQQFLTGTQTVILRERFPDAYSFQVLTRTSETPSSAQVLAALVEQKPAGLVMLYNTISGNDYQLLITNHSLYSNVFADYATYQGVVNDAPGT